MFFFSFCGYLFVNLRISIDFDGVELPLKVVNRWIVDMALLSILVERIVSIYNSSFC